MPDEAAQKSISERVQQLERENRWMKAGFVLLVGTLAFVGFDSQDPSTVEATQFILKDSSGQQRGKWYVSEDDKPSLVVGNVDSHGQFTSVNRGGIVAKKDSKRFVFLTGGFLRFYNGQQVPVRLEASSQPVGSGNIGPQIAVSTSNHGHAIMGRERLEAPETGSIEVRPASSLILLDEDGNVIEKMP